MLEEFLSWYLAPWRRIGRAEFSSFLAVASIPGFLFMVIGFTDSTSGWLAPVASMLDVGKQMSSAASATSTDTASLQHMADQLTGKAFVPEALGTTTSAVFHFDWAGFVNNLLQLLMIPLCRMRLRDMGKIGMQELVLTGAFNLSAADGLIGAFGLSVLPMGWLFTALSFGGFIWLCVAGSAPRVPPHERIPQHPDDHTLGR